jgi:hypothetical protein
MTLLADAVPSGGVELCGIDDCAGARIREMLFNGPMASLARDPFRLGRKNWRSILIQCARYVQRRSRMAQKTFFTYGTREIGIP